MNVRDYYKIVIGSISRITGVGEIPMILCNREECVDARSILIIILLEKGLTELEIARQMNVTPQCVNRLKNKFQERERRWSVINNLNDIRAELNNDTTGL